MQKHINRDGQEATAIFDNRSVRNDYRTLTSLLKPGMFVLDVGCGTGAITKDIASLIGDKGKIIGIDHTLEFIESGKKSYSSIKNLELIHIDLLEYEPEFKFDLIVSARTIQWLSEPLKAIKKMKSMLEANGILSILDYNHENIQWNPSPPQSMLLFYDRWLKWRNDAGMNNRINNDLPELFRQIGLKNIEILDSSETYYNDNDKSISKIGIWGKVAGARQISDEGYITNEERSKAILEYDEWLNNEKVSLKMDLKEVRGYNGI